MNNKASIYKIVDRKTNETYYGCTRTTLKRRLSRHKARKSCTCRDIVTRNNFDMIVVEEHDNDNISDREILERERHFIVNFDCVNKVVPLQTRKEYYEKNKEYLIKKQKWWKLKKRCQPILNSFIFRHMSNINKLNKKPPTLFNFVTMTFPNNNI